MTCVAVTEAAITHDSEGHSRPSEEGEMAACDGERGPGRARRAGTGRASLVGLRAIEDPGAPRPLLRAHGPTPLLRSVRWPVCMNCAREGA